MSKEAVANRPDTEPVRYFAEFLKGLVKENPVLVMLLGTCPTLGVTLSGNSALGMGLATTFVLVCSNVVISLLKRVIPRQVRLPCFIVIIAGFVTLVRFILQAYVPDLFSALGVFLELITVNCIILGRAEMFASKNNVRASALDGLGMGLGFAGALLTLGIIREVLGNGSFFGLSFGAWFEPIVFFRTASGGFFVFGLVIAVMNIATHYAISRKKMGCQGCPSAAMCRGTDEGDESNTAEGGE